MPGFMLGNRTPKEQAAASTLFGKTDRGSTNRKAGCMLLTSKSYERREGGYRGGTEEGENAPSGGGRGNA